MRPVRADRRIRRSPGGPASHRSRVESSPHALWRVNVASSLPCGRPAPGRQSRILGSMALDFSLAEENYCYLTTTGRVSGKAREIEVWFGLDANTLYMLSGGRDRSDWVKNL